MKPITVYTILNSWPLMTYQFWSEVIYLRSKFSLTPNYKQLLLKQQYTEINICSVYIPPNDHIDKNELNKLIVQLCKLFILLGDLNSHNTIWGNKQIEKWNAWRNNRNNLFIYTQSAVYLNPTSGNLSAIDLTLCDPLIYIDYDWRLYQDTCSSDHFPIVLEISEPNEEGSTQWKLKRVDWGKIQKWMYKKTANQGHKWWWGLFTKTLNTIAAECISKWQIKNIQNKPWFDKDCQEATTLRLVALWKFSGMPTTQSNWVQTPQSTGSQDN